MEALDLPLLLQAHVALALFAAISVSPAYNLPIFLFGLASQSSVEGVRVLASLLAVSGVLDVMWLISGWTDQSSVLSMILVIGSLVLKPVTLLATLGNLRQRGEPTFSLPSMPGSFNGLRGGGNSQTVWSAPSFGGGGGGGNNTSHYQGFAADEDEEESLAPQTASRNSLPRGGGGGGKGGQPVQLQQQGHGEQNYHTLGDE